MPAMIALAATNLRRLAGGLLLLCTLPASDLQAGDLNPAVVGIYATPDAPANIVVEGTRAYVTCSPLEGGEPALRAGALMILDSSPPNAPALLGTYSWPAQSSANGVTVRGDLAYVAVGMNSGSRLEIINVRDPSAPYRVGGYRTSGELSRVWLAGDYAYIADGEPGLVVLNVSDPANPRRMGGLDGMGDAGDVVVAGNYAYVADRYWSGTQSQPFGALRIVDVSDPGSPKLVGKQPTARASDTWPSLFLVGNTAWVQGDSALQLFDVSDATHPIHIADYGRGATGVSVGNRVYLVGRQGLQILDVSNPTSPRRLGGWDSGSGAHDVAVSGRHAYVLGYGGLTVLDLEAPANLPRVGGCDTPGIARGIAVQGNRAYVADAGVGLQIVDTGTPGKPVLLGTYSLTNVTEAVAASGNRAFVVEARRVTGNTYQWTLHVVDVSDATAPKQLGTYETAGYSTCSASCIHQAFAVNPTGELAVLGVGNEGGSSGRVEMIDLRSPTKPVLVATYPTSSEWLDLAMEGRTVVVTDIVSGLAVLDVNDPADPRVLGTYDAPGWSQLALSGTRAFLTSRSRGLEILDLSDPTQPRLLGGNGAIGANWNGLASTGKFVFGATGGAGVQVVDAGNPADPHWVGGNSAALANDVTVSGDHLFVAAEADGLQVFDLALGSAEPLPTLAVARSAANRIEISWPADAIGFVLETNDSLSPASGWAPAPAVSAVAGDKNVVTMEIGSGAKFFRLKKP